MSQENVEIVRAFIDAFNQGDLEAAFKHMDSDFELDASRTIGVSIRTPDWLTRRKGRGHHSRWGA